MPVRRRAAIGAAAVHALDVSNTRAAAAAYTDNARSNRPATDLPAVVSDVA